MPTYLPLTAISRSQRVRIAGQTLLPGSVSFVDVGLVDPPGASPGNQISFTTSAVAAASNLVKGKFYGYVVTSVDASGNETQASPVFTVKAAAGAEGASEFNTNTPEWAAVPHAKKYKVYSTPVAGAATAAAAKAESSYLLIGETEATKLLDNGQERKAAKTPPSVNKTYYTLNGVYSTHKDLQAHFAIGAVQQLGGYSNSNLRFSPIVAETPESKGWVLTFASKEFKVSEAKGVVDRVTGQVREKSLALTGSSFESGGASKIILAIVVYNTTNGELEKLSEAEETVEPGSSGAIAYFGKIAKKVTAAHQVLYVVQAKIGVVSNVTGTYLTGNATPTLGDITNLPAVGDVS